MRYITYIANYCYNYLTNTNIANTRLIFKSGIFLGELSFHDRSIEDTVRQEMFKFVPVPASEYLTLMYHATADFTVQIYTVTGQKMAEINMKGGNTGQYINIDAYTTGIYYYEIMRGKGVLQRGNLSIVKYK